MTDIDLSTHLNSAIFDKNYSLAGEISYQFNSLEYLQQTLNTMICVAPKWGNLDFMKFCLNSPLLKVNADIHYLDDMAIQQAAIYHEFNIVKYLLTSPELKEHANINEPKGFVLSCAAEMEDLELIKYFLFSNELKENSNIHINNDYCFISSCLTNKHTVIDYFLFEYNIPKTHSINQFINDNDSFSYLHKTFEKRDLYNSLNNTIPHKTYRNSLIKI